MHVKDGAQTACRHNLNFAPFWGVFEHSLPFADLAPYQPMMAFRWRVKGGSESGLVRMSANWASVGVACMDTSWRSTCSLK